MEFMIAVTSTNSISWSISRAATGSSIIFHSSLINGAAVTDCEITTSGAPFVAHVYGLYWSSASFAHLYIDGVRVCSYTSNVPTMSSPTLTATLFPCPFNVSRCGGLPPVSYLGPYSLTISYYRYRSQTTCGMSSLCGATCATASDTHYCNRIGDACSCPFAYTGTTCSTPSSITASITYVSYGNDSTCTGSSVTSVLAIDSSSDTCYAATSLLATAPPPLNYSLCPSLETSLTGYDVDVSFTIEAATGYGVGEYRRVTWSSDTSSGNCSSTNSSMRAQFSASSSCAPISLCELPTISSSVTYGTLIPTCSTPCTGNRQCDISSDTCVCITGWSGASCTTPVCTEDCSLLSNTTCTGSLDMCACNAGYYGWNIPTYGCPDRAPAGLSYTSSSVTLNVSSPVTLNTPSMTSGSIGSHNGIFTVSPSLPLGWSLSSTTGVITSNSTLLLSSTLYTITFCNYIGCTSTSVTYSVTIISPYGFKLIRSSDTMQRDIAIVDNTVLQVFGTNTGAYPIKYGLTSWSPQLPNGLTLDADTGAISGTPIQLIPLKRVVGIVATNFGGSTSANWTVLVATSPSLLTYTITTAQTYKVGTSITTNTVASVTGTNSVDVPITYSISPSLPSGMSISSTTGSVSGTPSVAVDTTVRTINASNSIGWTSTTLTVTTAIAPSNLVYTVTNGIYKVSASISANTPSITGTSTSNTPMTFAVSPSLPSGLSISSTTGAISGTPTSSTAKASYTVTATNAVGSTTASVNITCMITPSSLAYSSSSLIYGLNAVINNTVTSLTGDAPFTWSITPTLPGALYLSSLDGRITGVATVTSPSTSYTITVSNAVGSTTASITLAVLQTPSGFSYPQSTYIWPINVALTGVAPTLSTLPSGSAVVFSITSGNTLPTGVILNATDGSLYGTPTTVTALTTYSIVAANSVGNVTAYVSLVVAQPLTLLSYTLNTAKYRLNSAITTNSPSLTGTVSISVPVTYSVLPSLPTGLSLSTTTGSITGTPTVVIDTAAYVVTATNVLGSVQRSLSLTIAMIPSSLSYGVTYAIYLVGSTITDNIATVSGTSTSNTPITFGISPSLPTGLSISTTTGTISGTPSVVASNTSYVVTATNAVGSTSVTLAIACLVASSDGSFTYVNTSAIYRVNSTITSNTVATLSGTYPMVFSSVPPLPNGLLLDTATGELSGACSVSSPTASYTLVATNAVGSVSTVLNIACWLAPSSLLYTTTTFYYPANVTIVDITPSLGQLTTGTSVIYSASPALPIGLVLGSMTGTLSGTPDVSLIIVNTAVVIFATNTVGFTSITLRFTVQPQPIAPVYPVPSTTNGVFGFAIGSTNRTYSPSSAKQVTTTYSISPLTLPTGLSFSTSTGTISGTATSITDPTYFTITSSNLVGSASTVLGLATCYRPSFIMLSQQTTLIIVASSMPEIYPYVQGTNTDTIPFEFSVSPSLPTGVSINNRTGVVSGTPISAMDSQQSYIIAGRNPAGSITTRLNLQAVLPSLSQQAYGLSYSQPYATYQLRTLITTNRPVIYGTSPFTFSYLGTLPAGLTFSTTTGYITGTPTSVTARGFLTITAANLYGSTSAALSIAVVPVLANATYPNSPMIYAVATAITNTPTVTVGSTPIVWTISPSLPVGILFSSGTGLLTGSSSVVVPTTTYNITLSNPAGNTTIQLELQIVATATAPSGLTYGSAVYPPTTTIVPTLTAGTNPLVYTVTPTLPLGLTLTSSTGIISGLPREIITGMTYTITATNNQGSTQGLLNIDVIQLAPTGIYYPQRFRSLALGTTINIVPEVSPIDSNVLDITASWTIYPLLPAGITFDTSTGVISGTATTAKESQSYFITLTNVMGATNTTVYIEVPSAIALPQSSIKLVEVSLPGWTLVKFNNESIYYRFLDSLAATLSLNQTYLSISGSRNSLGTGNVATLIVRVYIRVVGGTAPQVATYLDQLNAFSTFAMIGFPFASVNTAPTYIPPVIVTPTVVTTSTPFFSTGGGKALIAFLVIGILAGLAAGAYYYYIKIYKPNEDKKPQEGPKAIPSSPNDGTKKGPGTFAPGTSHGDHGSAPRPPHGSGSVAIELGTINYEHKGEGEVVVTIGDNNSTDRAEGAPEKAPSPIPVSSPPRRSSSSHEDLQRRASGLQPIGSPSLPPRRGQPAGNPPLPPRRNSTDSPSSATSSSSPAKRRPSVNGQPAGNPPLPPRRHSISQSSEPATPPPVVEPSTPPPAPELDTMVPVRRPSLSGGKSRGTLSGKAPSSRNVITKSPSGDALAATSPTSVSSNGSSVASPTSTTALALPRSSSATDIIGSPKSPISIPPIPEAPEEGMAAAPAPPPLDDIPPPVPSRTPSVTSRAKAPAKAKRQPSTTTAAAKRASVAAPVAVIASTVATSDVVEEPRPKSKTPKTTAAAVVTATPTEVEEPRPKSKTPRPTPTSESVVEPVAVVTPPTAPPSIVVTEEKKAPPVSPAPPLPRRSSVASPPLPPPKSTVTAETPRVQAKKDEPSSPLPPPAFSTVAAAAAVAGATSSAPPPPPPPAAAVTKRSPPMPKKELPSSTAPVATSSAPPPEPVSPPAARTSAPPPPPPVPSAASTVARKSLPVPKKELPSATPVPVTPVATTVSTIPTVSTSETSTPPPVPTRTASASAAPSVVRRTPPVPAKAQVVLEVMEPTNVSGSTPAPTNDVVASAPVPSSVDESPKRPSTAPVKRVGTGSVSGRGSISGTTSGSLKKTTTATAAAATGGAATSTGSLKKTVTGAATAVVAAKRFAAPKRAIGGGGATSTAATATATAAGGSGTGSLKKTGSTVGGPKTPAKRTVPAKSSTTPTR
jgi:hypothetical protein